MSDDIFDEIVGLGAVHPGAYPPMERYRDYRAVFMATDQGRRVLQDILLKAGFYHTALMSDPLDMGRVVAREGSRTLALDILNTTFKEPSDAPARATNIKPEREA